MSFDLASAAYVLGAAEGEALWFADALVTYKATGAETRGALTVAEVRAPLRRRLPASPAPQRGRGLVRHRGRADVLAR